MLTLELVVEPSGDPRQIESGACASGYVGQRNRVLLVERERDSLELLKERVPRLRRVKSVLATSGGLTQFAFHPLPNLRCVAGVSEDDQVLVCRLRGRPKMN